MAVAFSPTQELTRGDLDIFLTNAQGNPANAAEITYALYYVDPGPPEAEVLIGSDTRTPVNPAVGEYYAALMIPAAATVGTYRIRWTFREFLSSPQTQVVQEFAVVASSALVVSPYSDSERDMINTMRVLLRDADPDRNYHFRPPEHECDVGQYNRVFGYVWTDPELLVYLERALDWWNMFPPRTSISSLDCLMSGSGDWSTAIYYGAMSHALMALAINWVAEEFDYSIGGVSLSIDKSSKYESLKSNAESQFDKATEAKQRTVKFIRGLQQPKYGIGIRSAFGPAVGRGILSPRNFLVLPLFLLGGKLLMEVLPYVDSLSSLWS